MLGLIVSLIVIGLVARARTRVARDRSMRLARLLVPGKQSMSIPATILLGVVGSFIGGLLGYLIFRKDGDEGFFQPSGIIGSIIGSVVVLLLWQRFGNRSRTRR